jgi:hypothetical protein
MSNKGQLPDRLRGGNDDPGRAERIRRYDEAMAPTINTQVESARSEAVRRHRASPSAMPIENCDWYRGHEHERNDRGERISGQPYDHLKEQARQAKRASTPEPAPAPVKTEAVNTESNNAGGA